MATLRAAAYILNSALLLFVLYSLTKNLPDKSEHFIIVMLILSYPIVSIATIALHHIKSNT